jgi:hypothetical protein
MFPWILTPCSKNLTVQTHLLPAYRPVTQQNHHPNDFDPEDKHGTFLRAVTAIFPKLQNVATWVAASWNCTTSSTFGYRLDDRKTTAWFPKRLHSLWGPSSPLIQRVPAVLSLGVKGCSRKADRLPQFSAKLKKQWLYIPLPIKPIVLKFCLTDHKNSCILWVGTTMRMGCDTVPSGKQLRPLTFRKTL